MNCSLPHQRWWKDFLLNEKVRATHLRLLRHPECFSKVTEKLFYTVYFQITYNRWCIATSVTSIWLSSSVYFQVTKVKRSQQIVCGCCATLSVSQKWLPLKRREIASPQQYNSLFKRKYTKRINPNTPTDNKIIVSSSGNIQKRLNQI